MMSIEKRQIRASFDAATIHYDAAADWQKTVGSLLLEKLKLHYPQSKAILDLGVGTGYLSRSIEKSYPDCELMALDIVESMLLTSKMYLQCKKLICADAESMPVRNKSIDIVISNMVVHWCNSLRVVIQEQYRILKSNGVFIFSILGSQSMLALKDAWSKIDNHTHINDFPTLEYAKMLCLQSGFTVLSSETLMIEKYYVNVFDLMRHLKKIGSKNISLNKPRNLVSRNKMKKLNEYYQNPLHYEVIVMVCKK
ncbi:malonyl-ACP O-methyltransferase BioC [Candidiatus Paracoxiella cheracis]|uniref:malonyl-ACP O-methyltransferase BioC n=1 Tax=Candidiatus Paracoxiella cheracis TaxID=3405120 RepID=UPI003BF47C08